jgi:hypothetical protein
MNHSQWVVKMTLFYPQKSTKSEFRHSIFGPRDSHHIVRATSHFHVATQSRILSVQGPERSAGAGVERPVSEWAPICHGLSYGLWAFMAKDAGHIHPFFPVVLDLVIFLKSWMRQNRLVCDSRFKLCSDEVGDSATSWGWNPAISLCLKPTLPRLVLFCGARKRYLYLCSVELFFCFCWFVDLVVFVSCLKNHFSLL